MPKKLQRKSTNSLKDTLKSKIKQKKSRKTSPPQLTTKNSIENKLKKSQQKIRIKEPKKNQIKQLSSTSSEIELSMRSDRKVFLVEYEYFYDKYTGPTMLINELEITKFCVKHNQVYSNFYFLKRKEKKQVMGLCGECAVFLAKKGLNIEYLDLVVSENKQQDRLQVIIKEANELMFQLKLLNKKKFIKLQHSIKNFHCFKSSIEDMFLQMIDRITEIEMTYMREQQEKFENCAEERLNKQNEINETIKDIEKIRRDLIDNEQTICSLEQEQRIEQILSYLEGKIQNHQLFFEQYKISPPLEFDYVDTETIIKQFTQLFENFIQQHIVCSQRKNDPLFQAFQAHEKFSLFSQSRRLPTNSDSQSRGKDDISVKDDNIQISRITISQEKTDRLQQHSVTSLQNPRLLKSSNNERNSFSESQNVLNVYNQPVNNVTEFNKSFDEAQAKKLSLQKWQLFFIV